VNHYISLLIVSLAVSTVFSLISKEAENRRIRYFTVMLAYMVAGSLMAAWLMYFIPW